MTLFCGGDGLGFNFRCIGSKVLPRNTEVPSRADGISQSLQFINFQRRAAALRWSEIWVLLVRERSERGMKGGSLIDSYTRTKGSGTKDAAEMHHSAADQPRWRYIPLWMKKPGFLMGPHQTRAHIQQFWLWTVFAALSLRHFKAAASLRDMLHWLYRGAHSVRAFSLSLGKVARATVHRVAC